jgi:T5SS/PEP-CTERM-associated repeat protein
MQMTYPDYLICTRKLTYLLQKCRASIIRYCFGFFLLSLQQVSAADRFFTNSVNTANFTNTTSWMGGVAPGINDNANFTNNFSKQIDWTINTTNANAFFNPTGPNITYTQAIASSTWTITNQLIIGQSAAHTGLVTQVSGTLVVTNSAGTGTIIIGQAGKGSNSLNGGTIITDHLYVTNVANSDFTFNSGTLTLRGDSIISNNNTAVNIGNTAGGLVNLNLLGGVTRMDNPTTRIGGIAGATGIVVVAGSGTIWSNNVLFIGQSGSQGNSLTISNNAMVVVTNIILGNATSSSNNVLLIHNGGKLISDGNTSRIGASSSSNNLVVVAGSGSMFSNDNTLVVGDGGANNRFFVTNGGFVRNSTVNIGNNGGANSNSVLISGIGSFWTNAQNIGIGVNGAFNTLTISEGGTLVNGIGNVGANNDATNNLVLITGLGSLWHNRTSVLVGSNAVNEGGGTVLILNEGTLEANGLTSGFDGTGGITNSGGILQFSTANPGITNNGNFVITNGTISYRNIQNAPVMITNKTINITWQGRTNSFMLNNAANAILDSYIFTNGMGPTNYFNLTLINGTTRWQATNTTFGSGSTFLITNTTASVFGGITNSGGIRVVDNSSASFEGAVLGSGTINVDTTSAITFTNAAGTATISGVISGAGAISHRGADTLILSGNNTFSGAITNSAGTLQVNSATALGTSSSYALTGGTLLYNTGFTNTSANVVLNGGNIQEVDKNISLGTLTIEANSTLTLNSGGAAGSFRFASATNTSAGMLTIIGWDFNSATQSGANDLIFFTNTAFESASFLNNVTFFGYLPGAQILSSGELVPITPEPASLLAGWILSCLFGWKVFRRKSE